MKGEERKGRDGEFNTLLDARTQASEACEAKSRSKVAGEEREGGKTTCKTQQGLIPFFPPSLKLNSTSKEQQLTFIQLCDLLLRLAL